MRAKDALGLRGEALPAQHREASGLAVVDRNVRRWQGEIDLVAWDGIEIDFRKSRRG